ncbi:serine protease [Limnoraphis robusta Tam1]|uniref:S1 family peptidase n=1 Tax=Limnoraphis robusta TaxID=1118279 RepID=UPI002B1FA3FD|nr:serine protease [Limnoraphis robusta]MEA5543138.1 serine protease [Limnoraphis robusta Tam1]
MNLPHKLSVILVSLIAAIQLPIYLAWSSEEIGENAKKITVRIDGKTLGSGVIIKKEPGDENSYTYSVLTARHVILHTDLTENGDLMTKEVDYEIQTVGGKKYRVTCPNDCRTLDEQKNIDDEQKNIDLAVFKFSSDQEYKVAELGNSNEMNEGMTVYVAGYPSRGESRDRFLIFQQGMIQTAYQPSPGGYTLKYGISAQVGTSGGPVLDEQGRLIAIHGKADVHPIQGATTSNLGIPINIYKQLVQPITLIEACQPGNYKGRINQNQALDELQNALRKDVISDFTLLWRSGSDPRSLQSAIQNQPIDLKDVCKFYEGKDHQKDALDWLQLQIDQSLMDKFNRKY